MCEGSDREDSVGVLKDSASQRLSPNSQKSQSKSYKSPNIQKSPRSTDGKFDLSPKESLGE